MNDDLFGNVSSSDEDDEVNENEMASQKLASKRITLSALSDDSDDGNAKIRKNAYLEDEEGSDGLLKKVSHSTTEPNVGSKVRTHSNFRGEKLLSEIHVNQSELSLDKVGSKPFYVKLPKFVKIAPQSFEPTKYNAEDDRRKYEGVSSVIRWCYDPVNPQCILSNGAIVQYDDGSYELVVGESVFNAKIAPAENCFIFEQTKCSQVEVQHPDSQLLTSQEERRTEVDGSCLVSCGQVGNRMIFEPSSLDSAAHQRIHFNVRNHDQYRQEKRIGTMDLEKLQETQVINQKQFEKLDEKRRSVARQKKRAADSQPRRFAAPHRPYMNSQYLEGDEYEDYDDDDDDGGKLVAKPKKARPSMKARRRSESDDDEGESVGHDDEVRSEDEDDDDGADLDDFIEREDDDGDEDVNEEELDEKSLSDESDGGDEEPADQGGEDEDDDDSEDAMSEDGSVNQSKKMHRKSKKHPSKKEIKRGHKLKKKTSEKAKESGGAPLSKKRSRESDRSDSDDDVKSRAKTVSELSKIEDSSGLHTNEATESNEVDEDDEEEVVIHQSKKQRKSVLDSDDDE